MTNISPIEAFSDPTRRQLLERLRLSPCSVGDLVATVTVSQSAVSQHLRVLRAAGLVQVRQQGQQRIYSLDPAGLATLRAYVESFCGQVLDSYQDAAADSTQRVAIDVRQFRGAGHYPAGDEVVRRETVDLVRFSAVHVGDWPLVATQHPFGLRGGSGDLCRRRAGWRTDLRG